MNTNVNMYEMRMPKNYASLSDDEMEYCGTGSYFDKFLRTASAVLGISGGLLVATAGCAVAVVTGFSGVGMFAGATIATFGVYQTVENSKALVNTWTKD